MTSDQFTEMYGLLQRIDERTYAMDAQNNIDRQRLKHFEERLSRVEKRQHTYSGALAILLLLSQVIPPLVR